MKKFWCCSSKEEKKVVFDRVIPASEAKEAFKKQVLPALELKTSYRNDRLKCFGNTALISKEINYSLKDLPKEMVDLIEEYTAPSRKVQNATIRKIGVNNLFRE